MNILAASTISHQPTFDRPGFSLSLSKIDENSDLIAPDYNLYIPAILKRRLSEGQRMSIACAKNCLERFHPIGPDGIIVGTGMGCAVSTLNFLELINDPKRKTLSPTPYMLSTHNTFAGQISLVLGNHGYNATWTHNNLSFEHALMDAKLRFIEGSSYLIVGGVDETAPELMNHKARLKTDDHITCGASYFLLTTQPNDSAAVVIDVNAYTLIDEPFKLVNQFLSDNDVKPESISNLLFCRPDTMTIKSIADQFTNASRTNYMNLSGLYFSNSAFALHLACDLIEIGAVNDYILIFNNLVSGNLGLMLISPGKR